MSQGRAYSSVVSVPFLLAPRSPGPTIDQQVLVQKLEARFTKLDHARRTTGSFAHDDLEAGCALPPLISASLKGTWVESPWSKRPRASRTHEPTGRPSDVVDGLLADLGIPRDLAEVGERRKRLRLAEDEQHAEANGKGKGVQGTATATRQTSLASLGSSTKPGLASANAKPPKSASSTASASLRSQPQSAQGPLRRRVSVEILKPASSPGPAVAILGLGSPLAPITKSSPATPVGSPRTEREEGGRSLGEDEEILFEQGCTQVRDRKSVV